jgi:acyl-coenzyme A synthetase/AMP-(fatty) acid ligase
MILSDPSLDGGTIPERFRTVAARLPQATALVDDRLSLTYAQLDAASDRIAAGLAGLDRSRPVGLVFPHGASALVALLGVLKSGIPAMPADPPAMPDGAEAVLATAQLIIATPDFEPWCRQVAPGVPLATGLPDMAPAAPVAIRPDDPSVIYLTSGSSGAAKGVVHSHRSSSGFGWHGALLDRMAPGDRVAHIASFAHAASLTTILAAWFNGAALHAFDLRGRGAADFPRWAEQHGITVMASVAVGVMRRLMDVLARSPRGWQPRSLRMGGEQATAADIRRLREELGWRSRVSVVYVSTDAGYIAAWEDAADAPAADGPLPAGRPSPGRRVFIADEDGRSLPFGEAGEIVVAGNDLPLGYWQLPDLTAATYRADSDHPGQRMVFTGDLGQFDAAGMLRHLGRKDQIVKVRGHRVAAQLVEDRLRRQPGVVEAAVVAVGGADGVTRLVAHVEAAPGARPGPMALRRALLAELPEFMVPWRIMVTEALPRSIYGKVSRRDLPRPTPSRPEDLPAAVPPLTPTEASLAAAWSELFGFAPIGRDDDFFDLGGDSLDLATLVAQFEMDRDAFMDAVITGAQTLGAMAAALDAASDLDG